MKNFYFKANNKVRELEGAAPNMSVESRKILIHSFFNARFNYCPLIWMLHNLRNNNMKRNLTMSEINIQ